MFEFVRVALFMQGTLQHLQVVHVFAVMYYAMVSNKSARLLAGLACLSSHRW
jgi:hypothetical protein